ncbi:MAG TPA: hypothetical protein VIK11_06910 [Tepidiformaceae bacterium]
MRRFILAGFLMATACVATACSSTTATTPAGTAVAAPAKSDLERAAETLVVTATSASVTPSDVGRRLNNAALATTFECKNIGKRDIRAFSGLVTFTDLAGRTIKQVPLTWDRPIEAGATPTDFDHSFVLNRFDNDDKLLGETPTERLQVRFELQSVIYADGTRIGSIP